MKQIWKEICAAILMGFLLPGIMLEFAVIQRSQQLSHQDTTEPVQTEASPRSTMQMRLRREDGSVETMDMDAYLVGVVLAEMPSDFEPEAQKAQAVAARTFTRKAAETGGKHGDGTVCADPACCQAYISEADFLSRGGASAAVEQVCAAVNATSGDVLTYEGELIEATYFSCSGGSTEDAVAVWGTDLPYLRATDSPGEEDATHYTDTVTFSRQELGDILGVSLNGSAAQWLGTVTYTAGGGVNTIVIGGKEFGGTQLRALLGLRSTVFNITVNNDTVIIETRGFGHRVGMSQYGADAMAALGSTYDQILAHYYQGTVLEHWEN